MKQRVNLSLDTEALEILSQMASERKRGKFVSALIRKSRHIDMDRLIGALNELQAVLAPATQ